MKSVLLATRPLSPPWDEASKNFAYFLGRQVRGYAVTLLTCRKRPGLEGLPESAVETPVFSSPHFGLRAKVELFWYLVRSRSRYDITHYIFTPARTNARMIKAFARPRRGKTLQTVATLRDDLYSPEELRSLLFADRLVVYTDRSKEKLERLGFTNVVRIYPGIDLTKYAPGEKDASLLSAWGFTQDHFIVSYPGEYVRLGATDMLVEALIGHFAAQPETALRFVFACRVKNETDAVKKAEVKKRFAEAGLLGYVAFSDTISDMPALYNASDVIAFPVGNLNGKFDVPLIIIEAYACGKPVILSDLPEFGEFSNPSICVTIPKGSGEKFIDSVAYLKENPEKTRELGQNARSFVEERFDLRDTARRYEGIYAELSVETHA